MGSLLAHLYSRIKGSPEDVATMSLCYILENSQSANRTFCDYLSTAAGIDPFPELFFRTQVAGVNKERPDLIGHDINNTEYIICEAKFWAGLTANQPNSYLDRLRNGVGISGKALVFICPETRMISLWGELLRLSVLESDRSGFDVKRRINIHGIAMAIVSWREIIGILMQTLSAEHSPLAGDLQQLSGLCDRMDEQAFSPFKPEDFGIDKAQRIVSFYTVVDKAAEKLKIKIGASTRGLKPTNHYAGYYRYMRVGDYGISLQYNCKHWIENAETPFWLAINEIKDDKWVYAETAREKLRDYENSFPKRLYIKSKAGEILIPLYVEAYLDEQEVINQLVEGIKEVFDKLNRN